MDNRFRVISISLYKSSLAELDESVATLKRAGISNANRSALIRLALRRLDMTKVTREDLDELKRHRGGRRSG